MFNFQGQTHVSCKVSPPNHASAGPRLCPTCKLPAFENLYSIVHLVHICTKVMFVTFVVPTLSQYNYETLLIKCINRYDTFYTYPSSRHIMGVTYMMA